MRAIRMQDFLAGSHGSLSSHFKSIHCIAFTINSVAAPIRAPIGTTQQLHLLNVVHRARGSELWLIRSNRGSMKGPSPVVDAGGPSVCRYGHRLACPISYDTRPCKALEITCKHCASSLCIWLALLLTHASASVKQRWVLTDAGRYFSPTCNIQLNRVSSCVFSSW
jgi:hypothetical protein